MLPESGHSVFTYPLARRYPYRWVNWAVLIGGTVIAVLFSFVAVAGNAYRFVSVYATDPNATTSKYEWYQEAPFSWVSNMKATCQPTLLTAGIAYMTTNRGFVHTLDGMRSSGANGGFLSAAGYHNTALQDCDISQITVKLLRNDNNRITKSGLDYWTWGATSASATTVCTLLSDSGPLQVNLTMNLPLAENNQQIQDNTLAQNTTSEHIGMWYGFQLVSAWYGQLSIAMGYSAPDGPQGTDSWGTGTIVLTRNANVGNYTDPGFFECNAGISTDSGGLTWMKPPNTIRDWANQYDEDATQHFNLPNISTTVDAFGKSLYSLLLLDFGVESPSSALLSSDGVEWLQSINDTDLAATSGDNYGVITPVYDAETDRPVTVETTTQTTLFSQYLCSIPERRGGLSIFIAVVLANIVFLSACWTVFGWCVQWWLKRHDSQMGYCEGCVSKVQADEFTDTQPLRTDGESEEVPLQPYMTRHEDML